MTGTTPPRSLPRSLPANVRLPLWVYRALFPFAFLIMLPGLLLRIFRRGNYRKNFGQRFGCFSAQAREKLSAGGWTWVHAVSVGEMMMALKLARALAQEQPGIRLLLSTTTSTGYAVARSALAEGLEGAEEVELIYYPLDLPGIVRRVLDLVRPERLVLVDKELWPNLICECSRRRIPITIVNARISPRSERRIRKAHRWVAPFYALPDRVCLQDEGDRPRWEAVGVRPEALVHTGSLKFDHPPSALAESADLRDLLRRLGVPDDAPILLGGSTFPGEEELLTRTLLALRPRWPDLFLILVPRHVERTPSILAALAPLGVAPHLRTDPLIASLRPDLLIVNTTGELARWYTQATLCVIGKSFSSTTTGGQNPAEALFAGRPILFGPHMENFEPLASQLVSAHAATRLPNAEALLPAVEHLLCHPDEATAQVARGRALLQTHQGATSRIVTAILEHR